MANILNISVLNFMWVSTLYNKVSNQIAKLVKLLAYYLLL